jgi:FHS family L-fucose permease-like MFS transporter
MPRSAVVHSSARDSRVFHDAMLYVLSTITFLYTACEFAMWNWLPKYLVSIGMAKATALNVLSLGFACGMLVGRLVAARVLVKAAPLPVTVLSAMCMGLSSLLMLYVRATSAVAFLVFFVGLSMAPVFPTTIALVSRHFKQRAATAIGFAITCGFSGLVVSSPVIGWLSGPTSTGVHRGLMVIPALACSMAVVLLVFRQSISREPAAVLA